MDWVDSDLSLHRISGCQGYDGEFSKDKPKSRIQDRRGGGVKEWRCYCGQVVMAKERPQPIKWTDGHTCRFTQHRTPVDTRITERSAMRKAYG